MESPRQPRETSDRDDVVGRALRVHARHPEASGWSRVKARKRPEPAWPSASGVLELARDRSADEARGLSRLATELLSLVLLERNHEIGQHRVQHGSAIQRSLGERGLEARDALPDVVDDVALRLEPVPERRPR